MADEPGPRQGRTLSRLLMGLLIGQGLVWAVVLGLLVIFEPGRPVAIVAVGALVGLMGSWRLARSIDLAVESSAESVRRMEQELGAERSQSGEQRRLRDLVLSAMEEGVVLMDAGDRVVYANPAAGRLVGQVPEQLGKLSPLPLQRLVRQARAEGASAHEEVEHGRPARWLSASAVPLGAGEVLLVLRDVTEARRMAAVRRDFIADASHELKTPIAAVLAATETVQRALGHDPAAARRFADQAEQSARRLSRVVSDLLDLSRLETEPGVLQPVPVNRVVAGEVARLAGLAGERRVELVADLVEVEAPGIEKDLALAVGNLLDNALRHTDAGGRVRVGVAAADGEVVVEVADTGTGIPSRDLPRIFERFYRVDVARSRDTGGTGLGLAIVKHVAERHGGTVEASSELGRGSTFRLRLPRG